jgi:neutral ceramidase
MNDSCEGKPNPPPEPHLRAGAGVAPITPPLEVGILMSSVERRYEPFEGVRLPLHARALIVEKGKRRVALVSLELLGLDGESVGGMRRFKKRVVAAADQAVAVEDLILVSTHTHSAPESIGLSDLSKKECFRQWITQLEQAIGAALRDAAAALRPCRLLTGVRSAPGLAIHRRIKTTRGVMLSSPEPPPEIVVSREGPMDDRVYIAAFVDLQGGPLATLINATCHPVHEMCIPLISPDYPGEMSLELERRHPGMVALFLNGAAGNINPPTVSGGALEARRHGWKLAELVEGAFRELQPVAEGSLELSWQTVSLPSRNAAGESTRKMLQAALAVIQIGEAAFVFLPGEPFVEIALAIRAHSPWKFISLAGYAESYIGYIPTELAFREGGYETGPGRWSRVDRGSESALCHSAMKLLERANVRP